MQYVKSTHISKDQSSWIVQVVSICRVEPGTDSKYEPKFIVFYSTLLYIFSMFCFKCKADSPKVSMKKNGTMVTVQQHCTNCPNGFTQRNQTLILGKYPADNVLVSFAILMVGTSINKILLVFKHFGMQVYKALQFFYHQSQLIFPAILHYWESYQLALTASSDPRRTWFHGTFYQVWSSFDDMFTIQQSSSLWIIAGIA